MPAYFAPGPEWERLLAAAPTVGAAIVNPASGPGDAAQAAYVDVIGRAMAKGIRVLGYVATDYGQRPAAAVLDDIKRYYDFYAPSGIYLSEGPMDPDCATMEATYLGYADAARKRDDKAYIAIGTRFCPTYIYFTDLMVQFARARDEYLADYRPPSWMPSGSPSRFCHFVHTTPGDGAGGVIDRIVANGAGWLFVTDETDPNPWGRLPSYFDDEVRMARAYP